MYLPYFSAKYAAILALPLKTTPPSNSNIGTIPSGVALKDERHDESIIKLHDVHAKWVDYLSGIQATFLEQCGSPHIFARPAQKCNE